MGCILGPNMYAMFSGASNFNQKYRSLEYFFGRYRAMSSTSIFNQPLNDWNTFVASMGRMFFDANSFDQDISNWVTSTVWDMRMMFEGADSFNQDISDWNVSIVTRMNNMFRCGCTFR